MRRRPQRAVACLAVAAVLTAASCARLRRRPPNVLFISLDTVRQDVLGCYGHRPKHAPGISTTPALDALAAEGVRLVDAYASSSWTLPSHLSMLTGEPPLVHGVETEVGTLDASSPTLAEILRARGYRTAGFYSAPYLEPHWGFGRGFERYDAIYQPGVVAASQRAAELRAEVERVAARADWTRYDALKREEAAVEQGLVTKSQEAVTSDAVADAVVAQLETFARDSAPWFVFAHFFDPHCDYVPPPPYDTRFDPDYSGPATGAGCLTGPWVGHPDPDRPGGLVRTIADRDLEHVIALYEGEVAWVDAHVGRILDALARRRLAASTLVVVTSDHGEEFFEHGNVGHRHGLYEEAIRIPLLLRLPGTLPAGAAVRGPVSVTDLVPTILDVLDVPHPPSPGATSFLPLIRGREDAAERTARARLVMMYAGAVDTDTAEHVVLREVMVEDVFHQGPIKVTRTRTWPQFPGTVPAALKAVFDGEAAAQYAREDLTWIDVARYPDEPLERRSADFGDPAARRVLDAFRKEYAALAPLRHHQASPLPENVRLRLESLGYVERAPGPAFPEPDVVLPPPGEG